MLGKWMLGWNGFWSWELEGGSVLKSVGSEVLRRIVLCCWRVELEECQLLVVC